MSQQHAPGQIIILNGTPRSGKSSIVAAIQHTFDGVWMNWGVDHFMQMTPARYLPGIGLRPGGERPDLEPLIVLLYRALYDSIAAHSRLGLNVVVDIDHHDAYAVPRRILPDCVRRLTGLPVLFVGVRCPLDIIMEWRRASGWNTESSRRTNTSAHPFVAGKSPSPGHLRLGSRYVAAHRRNVCDNDTPYRAWSTAISI